jgi:hypothetical protein
VHIAAVGAGGESTGIVEAHEAEVGYQLVLGLLCREGETNVFWTGRVDDGTATSSPPDGILMQSFDAGLEAVGETKVVVSGPDYWGSYPWGRPLETAHDRILLTVQARVVLASADGSPIVTSDIGTTPYANASFGCSPAADRCAGIGNGSVIARVFDPIAPASSSAVTLRRYEAEFVDPDWFFTWGTNSTIACDEEGICIAAWELMHEIDLENGDIIGPDVVGIFGRAINLSTGELGPEVPLASSGIVNVGPAQFVSVERDANWRPVLRALRVE